MKDNYSILIIDDTQDNLLVLGEVFGNEGYDTILVDNAREGLEHARANPAPDLILLDVKMPEMDGYEVCKILKDSPDTKDIPVIFLTGMSDPVNEEKGLKLGAVDYIHKPFSISLVNARVRNQLELQKHKKNLTKLVEKRTAELAELNAGLEKRIAEEVEKSIQKDHLMFQQARLAAMGEMLSYIAHQWRQPLNNLGLEIQSLPAELEDGNLDAGRLAKFVESNMAVLDYLSHTIDDFRNFFKREHKLMMFDPYQMIEKAIAMVRTGFEQAGITITLIDSGSKPTMGYGNEFSQVILNIITNAKDVLLERHIKEPIIEVRCYCKENINYITVKDNGGGIKEEIIDKIFDPYFTTKFQSQGTGIGLYMAKMIIEKHMEGSCSAKNTTDGTDFIITLPISCKQ